MATTAADLTTSAVVLAASGGIGALAGGLISSLVNLFLDRQRRKEDHRKWLRDQKMQTYAQYLGSTMGLFAGEAEAGKESVRLELRMRLLMPEGTADEVFGTIARVFQSQPSSLADYAKQQVAALREVQSLLRKDLEST